MNYELNWIDSILPAKYSSKVKNIIFKLLKFFVRLRDFNIIMILLILIVNSFGIVYLFSIFLNNLEDMCELYLKYKNNK